MHWLNNNIIIPRLSSVAQSENPIDIILFINGISNLNLQNFNLEFFPKKWIIKNTKENKRASPVAKAAPSSPQLNCITKT